MNILEFVVFLSFIFGTSSKEQIHFCMSKTLSYLTEKVALSSARLHSGKNRIV